MRFNYAKGGIDYAYGGLHVCPRCGEFEDEPEIIHTPQRCRVFARRLARMALVHELWRLDLW